MNKDWLCSFGGYLGSCSVCDIELPREESKWRLDFTKEGILGSETCIYDGCLYLLRRDDQRNDCLTSVDIRTGNIIWNSSQKFEQRSQLSVNEKYISFGCLVFARKSGNLVVDLKQHEIFSNAPDFGSTILLEDEVIKPVSGFDPSDGYLSFNLTDMKAKKFDFNHLVVFACGRLLIGKTNDSVAAYSLCDSSVLWQFELPGGFDRFARVISNGENVFIKNSGYLVILDIKTGVVVRLLTQKEVGEMLHREIVFETTTLLMCDDKRLLLVNKKRNESWIILIDLNSFSVISDNQLSIYGDCCIAGEYFYTLDQNHNPIALELPSCNECWKSQDAISASRIVAGSNHVVYVLPAGGFQCYGSSSP